MRRSLPLILALTASAVGAAPQVRLSATHQATLAVVPLEILRQYATD